MEKVTAADALAFIQRHPHVYLLTRRPDGYPTGYPMMAQVGDGTDGTVRFSTYRASAKVRYLLGAAVAGILAVDPETGTSLWAEGQVALGQEPLPDPPGAGPGAGADRTPAAPVPPEVVETVGRRHREGKRVTLQVTLRSANRGAGPP